MLCKQVVDDGSSSIPARETAMGAQAGEAAALSRNVRPAPPRFQSRSFIHERKYVLLPREALNGALNEIF